MDKSKLKSIIEGIIFAVGDEGISAKELGDLLGMDKHEIELIIHELRVEWKENNRGVQIVKVAQVYRMSTLPEHQIYVKKLAHIPRRTQLSRSSLEVLAIVAYRQPITRVEIEEIRGVKSDHILQSLAKKELIRVVGRAEGAGRPILYGTTKAFLDYFGLNHLDDLPESRTIFNWKEWEEEKQNLFQRLGVSQEEQTKIE